MSGGRYINVWRALLCWAYDLGAIANIEQLRVMNAFKSVLDEMEERRSIHSMRSELQKSRSHPGPGRIADNISYIDEEVKSPTPDSPYDLSATGRAATAKRPLGETVPLLNKQPSMERSRSTQNSLQTTVHSGTQLL